MSKISIIVPVYKAQDVVGQCLDALLEQTFHDIEVVCVNDGSPDDSGKVLEAYAARDARVRVLTQENGGVSAARNAGIDAATGDIVMFADCDDAFEPQACHVVAEAFDADDGLDVLVFGAHCEPEDETPKHVRDLLSPAAAVFERDEAGRVDPALFFEAHAQPYAWRTAYRRAFINRERVRFVPGLALAEDAEFQILAYSLARKTRLLPDKLYRYRMDSSSATHVYNARASRERKVDQHLQAIAALLDEWRTRGIADFYGPQMVTWCLDLTLFDVARMEAPTATHYARRLATLLEGTYGLQWTTLPQKRAVRRAAQALARVVAGTGDGAGGGAANGTGQLRHGEFSLSKVDLIAFFIATRGIKQCVERFV